MASDSSCGFRRDISHFFTATKNASERVGENEQYKLGSAPSAKKAVLCDGFVQIFKHLKTIVGVYFARNFYKSH